MSYRDLLARLLPPVAYSPAEPRLNAELTAEGNAFTAVDTSASAVVGAVTPFDSASLLTDWERVLELTPAADDTWQQRLEAVLIKLAELGGISREYFINIAATAGYDITIDEFEPFRAGEGRAGDTIYSADVIWVWAVNVQSETNMYYFLAGESCAGESIGTFGDNILETIFQNLKPAHTFCYFTYEDEDNAASDDTN